MMCPAPDYNCIDTEVQQEVIHVKELEWTYQQQRCDFDQD